MPRISRAIAVGYPHHITQRGNYRQTAIKNRGSVPNYQLFSAMEVKSADLDRPVLGRSARSFIDAYHPEQFVILNRSLETTLTIDNGQIDFQTPFNMN